MIKEEDLSVADILRNMPKGTRLYSPICGYVELLEIDQFNRIVCNPPGVSTPLPTFLFNSDGTAYLGECEVKMKGECMLFPSHICRSWNSFYFRSGEYASIDFYYSYGEKLKYVILCRESNAFLRVDAYAALNVNGKEFKTDWQSDFQPIAFEEREMVVRPAWEDEIEMFNEAMDKAGYVWNAETKELTKNHDTIDKQVIPPGKFAPFDKVLVRDTGDEVWQPAIFSWKLEDEEYCYGVAGGLSEPTFFRQCIPFNERTAHLVGTSNPYKEDEV